MKKAAPLFLILILCAFALPIFAFKSGLPFQPIHERVVRAALTPCEFQDSALKVIAKGQDSQDNIFSSKFWVDEHHCDAMHIKEGYDYFRTRAEMAMDKAKYCYRDSKEVDDVRYNLGEGFHALQDFYSHSNWLEMQYYDRNEPICFRWDMYSSWDWNDVVFERGPWSALPGRLKTGHFSKVEAAATGAKWAGDSKQKLIDDEWTGIILDPTKSLTAAGKILKMFCDQRSLMISEVLRSTPGLRFATQQEYETRLKERNSFYRALSYAVEDEGKSLLHWELNKDDEFQIEGSMKTPSGKLLTAVAQELATIDTKRMWVGQIERMIWKRYGGCASLIVPAIKGNPIPEIKLSLAADPKSTNPVTGTVTVNVENMPRHVREKLKIKLKVYTERSDRKGTGEAEAKEKTLEFSQSNPQSLSLGEMKLTTGKNGPYDVVVKACFECDTTFKPAEARQTINGGSSKLKLLSATCKAVSGSEIYANEPAELTVDYSYEDPEFPEVHGEGFIAKAVGGDPHQCAKKDLLQAPGLNGKFEIYKDKWTPKDEGTYVWKPRIYTDGGDSVNTIVVIEVKKRASKSLTATSFMNKTEGVVGDTFTLTINYKIIGGPPQFSVYVTESSKIDQVDGMSVPLPDKQVALRFDDASPISVTKTLTFKTVKPGVYDWNFEISSLTHGSARGMHRFIVNPLAKLVVDKESVTPEAGPPGTKFTLSVKYHLQGMKPSDKQDVTKDSSISSGPAGISFARATDNLTGTNSYGSIDLTYTGTTPGDYGWNYQLNAGTYGTANKTLGFRVVDNTKRSIEVVSVSVLPAKDTVGKTFVGTLRYRLNGLADGATIQVNENDYVNMGGKTETHETVEVTATGGRIMSKVARFVSQQTGKHTWNFTVDANGYSTLYASAPFEVVDETVVPQIQARLDYPILFLQPGESKSNSIYIWGFRTNTADRVEVVYPQMGDFGGLPGQLGVFPGNTSMESWSMIGIGDFTKEYNLAQGYRARETAPPGTTPIKIIVRQKGAGQVTLTLFVTVVKRGENTQGKENPWWQPRVPKTGDDGTNQPGDETNNNDPNNPNNPNDPNNPNNPNPNDPNNSNGPDGQNGPGNWPGVNGPNQPNTPNGPGVPPKQPNTPNGPNAPPTPPSGPGNPPKPPGGPSGPGKPPKTGGPSGPGSTDAEVVTYTFSKVYVETSRQRVSEAALLPSGDKGQITESSSASVSVPVMIDDTVNSKAGTARQQVTAHVQYEFPAEITMKQASASDPTLYETQYATVNGNADADFLRTGPTSTFSSAPAGIFVGASGAWGPANIKVRDVKAGFLTGQSRFSVKWETSMYGAERATFASGKPAHQPTITIESLSIAQPLVAIGGDDSFVLGQGSGRVVVPLKVIYKLKSGNAASTQPGAGDDDTLTGQNRIKARLERDTITLIRDKTPGEFNDILIRDWKRDTREPIWVIYPGQSFGSELPNEMRVLPGSGQQDPVALDAVTRTNGEYGWNQGYEAKRSAKPGVYKIPIIVRQKGAGAVELTLTVKIIDSPPDEAFNRRNPPNVWTQPPLNVPWPGVHTPAPNTTRPPVYNPPPTFTPPPVHIPMSPPQQQPPTCPPQQPQHPPTPTVPSLSGSWFGSNGEVRITQAGALIQIDEVGSNYPTRWVGTLSGSTIIGNWECPSVNQKGTFAFTLDRSDPTHDHLEGKITIIKGDWQDTREFYADRKK